MKKYVVMVSGVEIGWYEKKEDAEKHLFDAKHSFLALVHPIDCFYIKVVEKK